jgi:uncharacterized membrane protein YgdD (TMEM256/DUF423 family)
LFAERLDSLQADVEPFPETDTGSGDAPMNDEKILRSVLLATGIALFIMSVGLYLSLSGFTRLWVWPQAPTLALAFVGSWFAGGIAAVIWIGLSGNLAALRALMLTMLVGLGGAGFHLYSQHTLPGNERYLRFAILFAISAVLAIAVIALVQRFQQTGDEPAPPAIRWAFLVFAGILLGVGVALVFDAQRVFPVPLSTDVAAVYGWFFLGSFVYYFYGFLKPSIMNATGQMISFLVYDLLLIPPFLWHLPNVAEGYGLSLAVYLTVLVVSAAFCAYYLFIDPRTRLVPIRSRAVT